MTVSRLVILDRDGVINQDSAAYVKSASEWQPIPGSIEAVGALSKAGFSIAIATNQSGIGRGLFRRAAVYAMHAKLRRLVTREGGKVDAIAFCPHEPDAGCDCRKPAPGLLRQIARRTGCELAGSWLVGDSLRDLEAGYAVGCKLLLVRTGNGSHVAAMPNSVLPAWWQQVTITDDLASAADIIMDRTS